MAAPAGSSVVLGGNPLINSYISSPPPRAESPPRSPVVPAAGSSLSSEPVPGSLPPPKELTDSFMAIGPVPPPPSQERPPLSGGVSAEKSGTTAYSSQSTAAQHSLNSPERQKDKENPGLLPANSSSSNPLLRSGSIPRPEEASRATPTPGYEDPIEVHSLAYKVAAHAYKITQHFVIRSPQIFVAITLAFVAGKSYDSEPFAWEAATFVGVASTVYCLIRPLFLILIPYSLLPRKSYAKWRNAINTSNTILLTISLTSAIWKLKIPSYQGVALWAVAFGLPHTWWLSKEYPDLDGQFPNANIEPIKT